MSQSEIDKVYNYCCKLLKFRDRSLYEIESRLERKGVSKKVITSVIQRLIENNYLSEQRFVENYIQKNLTRGKSLRLILDELKQKYKLQDKTFESLNIESYKQQQVECVVNCIRKKFKKLDLQKIYNFLSIRGFDDNEIEQIISILKNQNL